MSDQIYVPVLGEGIAVWRPAPARRLDADTYEILKPDDYDPAFEHWQFPPGATVVCAKKKTREGTILAAVRLKKRVRRSA